MSSSVIVLISFLLKMFLSLTVNFDGYQQKKKEKRKAWDKCYKKEC